MFQARLKSTSTVRSGSEPEVSRLVRSDEHFVVDRHAPAEVYVAPKRGGGSGGSSSFAASPHPAAPANRNIGDVRSPYAASQSTAPPPVDADEVTGSHRRAHSTTMFRGQLARRGGPSRHDDNMHSPAPRGPPTPQPPSSQPPTPQPQQQQMQREASPARKMSPERQKWHGVDDVRAERSKVASRIQDLESRMRRWHHAGTTGSEYLDGTADADAATSTETPILPQAAAHTSAPPPPQSAAAEGDPADPIDAYTERLAALEARLGDLSPRKGRPATRDDAASAMDVSRHSMGISAMPQHEGHSAAVQATSGFGSPSRYDAGVGSSTVFGSVEGSPRRGGGGSGGEISAMKRATIEATFRGERIEQCRIEGEERDMLEADEDAAFMKLITTFTRTRDEIDAEAEREEEERMDALQRQLKAHDLLLERGEHHRDHVERSISHSRQEHDASRHSINAENSLRRASISPDDDGRDGRRYVQHGRSAAQGSAHHDDADAREESRLRHKSRPTGDTFIETAGAQLYDRLEVSRPSNSAYRAGDSTRSVRFIMTEEQERAALETQSQIESLVEKAKRRRYKKDLMQRLLERPAIETGYSTVHQHA